MTADYCYSTCISQDMAICTEIACVKPGEQGESVYVTITLEHTNLFINNLILWYVIKLVGDHY